MCRVFNECGSASLLWLGGGVVQPGAGLSTQIISLRSFTAARAEASTSRAPAAGGRGDYLSGHLAAADTDPGGHRLQLLYLPPTKSTGASQQEPVNHTPHNYNVL